MKHSLSQATMSRRGSVKSTLGSSRSTTSRKSQMRLGTRTRATSRFGEDDMNHEQPSKCACHHCQIRYPSRMIYDERDRLEMSVQKVLRTVDHQVDVLLKDLQDLVSFKSISVEPESLLESMKALEWVANRLANMKFKTYEHYLPDDPVNCFEEPHQKVLLARYFSSPTKNTLLIYAHLDVLPAKRDCWLQDPFELHQTNDVVYGRGVSSGKGMLVGWLQAIESWLKVHEDLPVNIKFIVDMLHEVGSSGLQDYVKARSDFFLDVDFMVFDTNSWLTNDRPVISCGLTGWAQFGVEVRGANKNLESGLAGGLVFEPMVDLCHLMSRLVNNEHELQIPHMDHNVKRLTTHEWQLLERADFQTYAYKEKLLVRRLRNETNKVEMLQSRWCKPTLSMHGVEGADSRPGCSRILPMKVMGKFSLKLVPDQELGQVFTHVKEYLQRLSLELDLGTEMTLHLLDACEPFAWSTDSKLTRTLMHAVGDVYQRDPIVTPGIPICLPIASVLKKLLNKPVLLLPYSRRRDRHHEENESVQELCLMQHAKVCASLLFELSTIHSKCKCDVIHEYCNLRGVTERLDAERGSEEHTVPKRNILSSFFRKSESEDQKDKRPKIKNRFTNFFRSHFNCKKPKKNKAPRNVQIQDSTF